MKVVVRENTSGLMGSFEAPVVVPELKQAPLKVSSVLLSTQLQTAKDTQGQSARPQRRAAGPEPDAHRRQGPEDVALLRGLRPGLDARTSRPCATSLAFYRGKVKVFETPVVERAQIDDASRKAAVFQLEVPPARCRPALHLPDQHHRCDRRQVRLPAPGVPAR